MIKTYDAISHPFSSVHSSRVAGDPATLTGRPASTTTAPASRRHPDVGFPAHAAGEQGTSSADTGQETAL